MFVWDAGALPPPFRVVLLGADCSEIQVFDDVGGPALELPPAVANTFAAGGAYHWTVEARPDGATVRSPLARFEIR